MHTHTSPTDSHLVLITGARAPTASVAMHTGAGLVDTPSAPISLRLATHWAEHGVQFLLAIQNCKGHGSLLQVCVDVGLVNCSHSAEATRTTLGWAADGTDTHCTMRLLWPVALDPHRASQGVQLETTCKRKCTGKCTGPGRGVGVVGHCFPSVHQALRAQPGRTNGLHKPAT